MNNSLIRIGKKKYAEIRPFNIFMHTKISENGTIRVEKPITRPGDFIILKPLLKNISVLIASCSVASGDCNNGNCTSIGYEIIN